MSTPCAPATRPTTTPRLALLVLVAVLATLLGPVSAEAAAPHAAQERRFLQLMNAERTSRGLTELSESPAVATVARNWSKKMAADGNLRHNPDVSRQLTVDWTRWGENVGWASNRGGGSLDAVTGRLHRGFMDSPGHRANILGHYNQVGVGVAVDGSGTMWATMVFVQGPITYEPTAAKPAQLTDIAGNPHRRAILTAHRRGLIPGCEGRRFCPHRVVTRAAMAATVGRMLHLRPSGTRHFSDVAGSSRVNALAQRGIVRGCTARRFCPSARVTRAQMASLLVRALPGLQPRGGARFADVRAGSVHRRAINALAAAGVTHGCAARRFCPAGRVTKGQLASFVMRALDG